MWRLLRRWRDGKGKGWKKVQGADGPDNKDPEIVVKGAGSVGDVKCIMGVTMLC